MAEERKGAEAEGSRVRVINLETLKTLAASGHYTIVENRCTTPAAENTNMAEERKAAAAEGSRVQMIRVEAQKTPTPSEETIIVKDKETVASGEYAIKLASVLASITPKDTAIAKESEPLPSPQQLLPSEAPRRRRKKNWTYAESILLVQLHFEHIAVQCREDSPPNHLTLKKRKAWDNISCHLSKAFPRTPRTNVDCRKKWFQLKKDAKQSIWTYQQALKYSGKSFFTLPPPLFFLIRGNSRA